MTVASCVRKIKKLNNPDTFNEDVRKIIGYYDHYFWQDWQIKYLERVADFRYCTITAED